MLGIAGVALSAIWMAATSAIASLVAALFTALTQGILAAGASVYASQFHIQTHKDK